MFKLNPEPVPEQETDRIQRLYSEWERRILWPKNELENEQHLKICVGDKPGVWCKCRTRQEEIHEWQDWAMENMNKSLDELGWIRPFVFGQVA